MVERALARMGVAAEVTIHIEKNLPVQGGLGAGSANAAAALIGLERELGVALTEAERLEIARRGWLGCAAVSAGGRGAGRGARGDVVGDARPACDCLRGGGAGGRGIDAAGFSRLGREASNEVIGDIDSARRSRWLTSPVQPDRLEELSHVYASVLGHALCLGSCSQSKRLTHPVSFVARLLTADRGRHTERSGRESSSRACPHRD